MKLRKPSCRKRQILIGIDFDDVLFSSIGNWLKKIGEHLDPPEKLTLDQMGDQKMEDFLRGKKLRAGIRLPSGTVTQGGEEVSPSQPGGRFYTYEFLKPDIYKNLKPIPEAQQAVEELFELKRDIEKRFPDTRVKIVCVTAHLPAVAKSRSHSQLLILEKCKRNLLREFMPELAKNLIFTYEKDKLGLNILIDDSPKNCRKIEEAGGQAVMIDCGTNRNSDQPTQVPHVSGISEAVPLVKKLVEDLAKAPHLKNQTRQTQISHPGQQQLSLPSSPSISISTIF